MVPISFLLLLRVVAMNVISIRVRFHATSSCRKPSLCRASRAAPSVQWIGHLQQGIQVQKSWLQGGAHSPQEGKTQFEGLPCPAKSHPRCLIGCGLRCLAAACADCQCIHALLACRCGLANEGDPEGSKANQLPFSNNVASKWLTLFND